MRACLRECYSREMVYEFVYVTNIMGGSLYEHRCVVQKLVNQALFSNSAGMDLREGSIITLLMLPSAESWVFRIHTVLS